MSTGAVDPDEYIRENHDMIAEVLRTSQDPYARACALVLLKHGGTERDIEMVKQEVERWA